MHNRIQLLLKSTGLTPARFAAEVDVQPSAISHILSGRNKPGFDLITKIMRRFPDVDPRWLLLGEGDMKSENMIPETPQTSELLVFEQDKIHKVKDLFSEGMKRDNNLSVQKELAQPSSANEKLTSPKQKAAVETITVFYSDGTFKSFQPR